MPDTAVKFIDERFKDNSPAATVAHIKSILASHNIEIEESWRESSVPYCYALSARVVGTTFSVNGKGLSRDLAQASCYGEMMERLQIGQIYAANIQKDGTDTFERVSNLQENLYRLLEQNGSWYERMTARLKRFTGISMTPEQMLKQYADKDGNLRVSRYYCLNTGKEVLYPHDLRGKINTTNGCAAGNTPEEALVQAMSEIVERHHMVRINDGGISLPEVPEDVLQRYKTAYQIITFIREQGYKVLVKDCSLGQKFPVVCVYIIDPKTGRYHTHFGAYPIFEIALERSLTESFQGRTIDNITRFENVLYKMPGEFSFASVTNELVLGSYEKTTSFFVGEPLYPFNENVGFEGKDNKTLLRECVRFFADQGLEIIAKDFSCLGFPTYQVLIPGYSEPFIHRMCVKADEHRYAPMAKKVLMDPGKAPVTDYFGFIMHDEEMHKYTSNIKGVHGFFGSSRLSASAPAYMDGFLMNATRGYVYYALGKYANVVDCINSILPFTNTEEAGHLICLKRFLSAKINRMSDADIKALLYYLHDAEAVDRLYAMLERKVNPLDGFVLHCDQEHCEGCRLEGYCHQKRVLELSRLLDEKCAELSFEDFSATMNDLLDHK